MFEATVPKKRLGELSLVITKGTTPTTYGYRYTSRGIPFLRIENITKAGKIDLYGSGILFVDESAHAFMQRSQLEKGDLVVSIAGTIGRVAVVSSEHVPGNCNQAVAIIRLRPEVAYTPYVKWYLLSHEGKRSLVGDSVQLAQANLSLGKIATVAIPLPSIDCQKKIADYIESIEAAIENLERIIAKLRQVRSGLINDLLTCGLDENGHLRDPIAHPEQFHETNLGLLPKAWDVVALGTALSMQAGSGLTGEDITEAGPYPVYGGNGQRGFTSRFTHEGRFVLIGRQGALCGNIAVASGHFFATEHAIVCTPVRPISAGWLACYLERMNLNRFSEASAQPGLSVQKISYKQIALPPLDEQVLIETRIDELDRLLESDTAELQKLTKLKSGLMDDLLTGRVRVPESTP